MNGTKFFFALFIAALALSAVATANEDDGYYASSDDMVEDNHDDIFSLLEEMLDDNSEENDENDDDEEDEEDEEDATEPEAETTEDADEDDEEEQENDDDEEPASAVEDDEEEADDEDEQPEEEEEDSSDVEEDDEDEDEEEGDHDEHGHGHAKESHGHGGGHHWGYKGKNGPSHWGGMCAKGRRQSPINIISDDATATEKLQTPSWSFDESSEDKPNVVFNGHTVQVSGNSAQLSFNNKEYKLLQFHFHSPSEHTVNGVRFPAEMHMVHQSTSGDGKLLVVGWFFDPEGTVPAYIPNLAAHFPKSTTEINQPKKGPSQKSFDSFVEQLVSDPKVSDFYTYGGSLTTPPCTEGVRFVIMNEKIAISDEDVAKLEELEGYNNRPTQPLNGRTVYKSFN